jgi:hypothetical protein
MARRGRPLKAGKRKNGRPIPSITFDKGTDRAQAMQVFYGTDGVDAIGRAYRSGLLGEGDTAKCLLDTARRIASAYWIAYSTGSYRCPLGDSNSGSVVSIDHERAKRREDWLNACLRQAETMGVRRQFDQLVIDINPDQGPDWMDRLIEYQRHGVEARVSDIAALNRALSALSLLADA